MTLTDAGPLIALIDPADPDHDRCVAALADVDPPLATSCAAFTEAMYFLGDRIGWRAQEALWKLADRGDVQLLELSREEARSAAELMRKYRDTPMDLADATLVCLAQSRGERRIFTLDNHFRAYRLAGRIGFDLLPGP